MDRYRRYASNIVFGLITAVMLGLGSMKVVGLPMIEEMFASINLTLGAARVIGTIEILMAIGLWVKPYRVVSSTVLALIFAGATGSHLGAGQGIQAAFPAIGLAILLLGGNLLDNVWKRVASPYSGSGAIIELKNLTKKLHRKAA